MAVRGILKGILQISNMQVLKNMQERIKLDFGVCRIQFRLGTGDKYKQKGSSIIIKCVLNNF
jgi:hypothetical protein